MLLCFIYFSFFLFWVANTPLYFDDPILGNFVVCVALFYKTDIGESLRVSGFLRERAKGVRTHD